MKLPLTFIMLSVVLSWFGCTPKYATVEYGQGGGVANDYNAFIIKEDGNLLVQKGEKSLDKSIAQTSSQARQSLGYIRDSI